MVSWIFHQKPASSKYPVGKLELVFFFIVPQCFRCNSMGLINCFKTIKVSAEANKVIKRAKIKIVLGETRKSSYKIKKSKPIRNVSSDKATNKNLKA
jgi:hypothetical protein